jgi:hypothetical protein
MHDYLNFVNLVNTTSVLFTQQLNFVKKKFHYTTTEKNSVREILYASSNRPERSSYLAGFHKLR